LVLVGGGGRSGFREVHVLAVGVVDDLRAVVPVQTVGVDVLGIGKDEVQGLGWVGGVVGLEVEDGLREPGGKGKGEA